MTRVLLVEDRDTLKYLFSDLIHNFWESDDTLELDVCSFTELETTIKEANYDICIFNIASNSATNYNLIKKMVETGIFQREKLVISSVSHPPELPNPNGLDIHYCHEDRFASECLPLVVG